MFGARIGLKYNSNSTHQTCWGAFVSLSIIIYLTYQLLLQAQNLMQGRNYQLVYSENSVEEPKLANISAGKFPFALGIKKRNTSTFLERELYQILGTQYTIQRQLNEQTNQYQYDTVQEQFQLEPCQETNFQIEEIKDEIKKYPIWSLYCIPQSRSYELQGQFESKIFKFIRLQVSYCNDSQKCSRQLLNAEQTSLYSIYVNRIIDSERLEEALIPTVQSIQWDTPSGTKNIDLRFKSIYVNSYIGTFFSSIQSQQNLLFSSFKESISQDNKNEVIFDLNLSLENNKESVYNIKQQTLLQFFSSIGGLVNCFYFIGLILAMPASKFSYNQKLLNSIFNFQLDSKQQEIQQLDSPPLSYENQKSYAIDNNYNQNNNNINNNNTINIAVNQNNRSIFKQNSKFSFHRSHTIQAAQTAREPLKSDITNKAYSNSIFRKNGVTKENDNIQNLELIESKSSDQNQVKKQEEIQIDNNLNKEQTTAINQDQTMNDFSTINLNDNQHSTNKKQEKLNESFFQVKDKKRQRTNTSQFCQNQDNIAPPFRYIRRCETQKLEDMDFCDDNKKNEDESKNCDEKTHNQQKRTSQQLQIHFESTNSRTLNQSKTQNQTPKNKSKLIDQINLLRNTIKITIQDQLLSMFCKKKIKSQMINYGIDKINDFLDINMLIKTIVEFQKLKRILLSQDQLTLFELIPPPVIHEQQFTNKISDEENEKECYSAFNTGMVFEDYRTQVKKMKDAQKSYNKIFKISKDQNKNPSFVDNQILLFIGQSLKKQFDENSFQ